MQRVGAASDDTHKPVPKYDEEGTYVSVERGDVALQQLDAQL
jgi:hypothetical protein